MGDFRMPALGADMEAATVIRWLVKPGDRVERGQIVAEVESEKGVLEIEIFEEGVVEQILVTQGQKVAVGTVLAKIRGLAEAARPAAPALATGSIAASVPPTSAAVKPPEIRRSRRRISPAARTLADTLGLDLDTIEGTGPEGAITLQDVRRASPVGAAADATAAKPASAPGDKRRAAMRASIAALMSRSKREVPHYYLSASIDMWPAITWLETENARHPVGERLLPAALLLKAVATALKDAPEMNGFFLDGAFRPSPVVHLGIAISLRDGGLIAPAIHDADRKSLGELMGALRDLVRRARAGVLRASEMSDPTITMTNLGEQGVETVFGVIYPPQVALVGFGRIVQRAWAANGTLGVHPVVTATLSGDHRASDGHRGARFLAAVDRLLQTPEAM